MLGVVVDRIDRGLHAAVLLERLASIRVHIKAREVAAAEVHSQAMTFLEGIARRVKAHGERIDLPRLHQLLFLQRVAEASTADAVGDVQVEAAGPVGTWRIDIDQLRSEVRVHTVGGYPELHFEFAVDFEISGQRLRLEDEDVIA